MYILVRTMHEDAITALRESDMEASEEVVARDDEVDRLNLLIGRQSTMVLQDMTLSRKMGVSLEDTFHYYLISRILERIGDHAAIIGTNVITLLREGDGPNTKLVRMITAARWLTT